MSYRIREDVASFAEQMSDMFDFKIIERRKEGLATVEDGIPIHFEDVCDDIEGHTRIVEEAIDNGDYKLAIRHSIHIANYAMLLYKESSKRLDNEIPK